MVVSTSKRRRKIDGREYDTPPPIPCTSKELDMLLDKWIADGIFKPNQVLREPIKEEWRDPAFTTDTTTCNILPQIVRRSAEWCTTGSKKGL